MKVVGQELISDLVMVLGANPTTPPLQLLLQLLLRSFSIGFGRFSIDGVLFLSPPPLCKRWEETETVAKELGGQKERQIT